MPSVSDYTADQIMEAIHSALQARDFPAVASLMTVLAVKDPDAAQAIYDTVQLAVGAGG